VVLQRIFRILEALDEQLIYNPTHSFAAEAAHIPEDVEPKSHFPISYEPQDLDAESRATFQGKKAFHKRTRKVLSTL
jgi:hypothetical protein